MEVSFCKHCHNEVYSPLSIRSGLVGLVEKGHSDTESSSLYDKSAFLLSFTKNNSIFHRSTGIFLIVAKSCGWMFILSLEEDNTQAPDSSRVFLKSQAHKAWYYYWVIKQAYSQHFFKNVLFLFADESFVLRVLLGQFVGFSSLLSHKCLALTRWFSSVV